MYENQKSKCDFSPENLISRVMIGVCLIFFFCHYFYDNVTVGKTAQDISLLQKLVTHHPFFSARKRKKNSSSSLSVNIDLNVHQKLLPLWGCT